MNIGEAAEQLGISPTVLRLRVGAEEDFRT